MPDLFCEGVWLCVGLCEGVRLGVCVCDRPTDAVGSLYYELLTSPTELLAAHSLFPSETRRFSYIRSSIKVTTMCIIKHISLRWRLIK